MVTAMAEWILQHAAPVATVAAALVAAGASLAAASLARRTQRQQAKLQVDFDERLAALGDSLERERTFASFSRERIAGHLDTVLRALVEVGATAHLVGKRTWVESTTHLETERTVYSAIQSLKVSARILLTLRAVPQPLHDEIVGATGPVWWEWGRVMDEVTLLDTEFRRAHPGEREFSPKEFNERWQALNAAITKLENSVVQLPGAILLPK
jgi:hypothetical protein